MSKSKFDLYKTSNSEKDLFTEELTVKVIKRSDFDGIRKKMVIFEGLDRPFFVFPSNITGRVKVGQKVSVTAYRTVDDKYINVTHITGETDDSYDKIGDIIDQGGIFTV